VTDQVTIKASGYDWVCVECGKEHYQTTISRFLQCDGCGKEIEVERLAHKFIPTEGKIHVTPAGYKFDCPECKEENFLGAATKKVKCGKCKAIYPVQYLQHNQTDCGKEPTDNQILEGQVRCHD
jgi:DNA-directed RNA polymerase subunit RPC12/RpoP